ncbi:MAG: Lrp/AsnC ligand binding domain-containing protein [Betaproteobacteria bacterium]|jgi:DNA-binding Lrp family transcriptional regulator
MVSAVVLVNTDLAQQSQVLEKIRQVKGVEEAHILWGVYDLLVKITANSIERLKEIIKHNLKQLTGVAMTLTLMIVD